jgi:hypothetical protein
MAVLLAAGVMSLTWRSSPRSWHWKSCIATAS